MEDQNTSRNKKITRVKKKIKKVQVTRVFLPHPRLSLYLKPAGQDTLPGDSQDSRGLDAAEQSGRGAQGAVRWGREVLEGEEGHVIVCPCDAENSVSW